jgi:glutathione S-transferase
MDITLYYAPTTCALAPYVTLTEAGADFKVESVNLRKKQQFTPEFLKINPKHKVPALVVDGKILTENVAIHPWVAKTFPEANLLPADEWDYLKALSLHSWCSGGIHPYLARINNPAAVCETEGSADAVVAHAEQAIYENLAVANDLLAGQDWFFDHFTTPDAHFFWCCRRSTEFGLTLDKTPNVKAHFERMLERDSVKKVYAFENEVKAQFAAAA